MDMDRRFWWVRSKLLLTHFITYLVLFTGYVLCLKYIHFDRAQQALVYNSILLFWVVGHWYFSDKCKTIREIFILRSEKIVLTFTLVTIILSKLSIVTEPYLIVLCFYAGSIFGLMLISWHANKY